MAPFQPVSSFVITATTPHVSDRNTSLSDQLKTTRTTATAKGAASISETQTYFYEALRRGERPICHVVNGTGPRNSAMLMYPSSEKWLVMGWLRRRPSHNALALTSLQSVASFSDVGEELAHE